MTEKVTPALLYQVARENQRNNQIGGETDGIDWDTAEDLGYTRPEDIGALVMKHTTELQPTASEFRLKPIEGNVPLVHRIRMETRKLGIEKSTEIRQQTNLSN
jgi:hypothetical protein